MCMLHTLCAETWSCQGLEHHVCSISSACSKHLRHCGDAILNQAMLTSREDTRLPSGFVSTQAELMQAQAVRASQHHMDTMRT